MKWLYIYIYIYIREPKVLCEIWIFLPCYRLFSTSFRVTSSLGEKILYTVFTVFVNSLYSLYRDFFYTDVELVLK